jgi:hypothetical protein
VLFFWADCVREWEIQKRPHVFECNKYTTFIPIKIVALRTVNKYFRSRAMILQLLCTEVRIYSIVL